MNSNSNKIVALLRKSITEFQLPVPGEFAIGDPLPKVWYEKRVKELEEALVDPYEIEVLIDDKNTNLGTTAVALILAETTDGDKLAYVPIEGKDDFVMVFAKKENDLVNWTYEFLRDSNPVNCFLSF